MKTADDKSFDFGAKLAELEAITEAIDSEHIDLDEAVTKFERGMELAGQLKEHLRVVENRVQAIKARFDTPAPAAPPTVDPFDTGQPPADLLD